MSVVGEYIIFDSGALSALADDDPRLRALLRTIARRRGLIRVPSVVLAECYGDPRHDAGYDRALRVIGGVERVTVGASIPIVKEAGRILRDARMIETIDAIVVATASLGPRRAVVVTGNGSHMVALACCARGEVGVVALNDLPVS